jgi:hypothetical protein
LNSKAVFFFALLGPLGGASNGVKIPLNGVMLATRVQLNSKFFCHKLYNLRYVKMYVKANFKLVTSLNFNDVTLA